MTGICEANDIEKSEAFRDNRLDSHGCFQFLRCIALHLWSQVVGRLSTSNELFVLVTRSCNTSDVLIVSSFKRIYLDIFQYVVFKVHVRCIPAS